VPRIAFSNMESDLVPFEGPRSHRASMPSIRRCPSPSNSCLHTRYA
jgi:hypothetical protein